MSGLDPESALFLLGGYAGIHENVLIDGDTYEAICERFEGPVYTFNDDDIEWSSNRAKILRDLHDNEVVDNCDESLCTPVIILHELHQETASRERVLQYLTEEVEIMRLFPDGVPLRLADIGLAYTFVAGFKCC